MTTDKRIMLLLIVVTGVIAASPSALKTRARSSKYSQTAPKLEIISSIPRYEFGKYDFGNVALLDNGQAWAVGYDGRHIERVYHSKDRGKSWDAVDVPGNGFTLKALSFSDPQNGWAVGGNGLVIRTTNGGKSWEKLKAPTRRELHAVHFANSRVGYIAGREKFLDKITDEVWGSIEIFCTKNGGETWRSCYKENKPSSVFQITTLSESEALVALDGNRLISTDNQGTTWHLVDLSGKQVSSVALAADGSLWVVGYKGTFERSEDRGRTWRHVVSFSGDTADRKWEEVAFNQAGMGIAVGESGSLAVTADRGKIWQLLDSGIQDHLRAVQLQDNYAIILGAKMVYSITIGAVAQK
jgi:photosystem II stability/assembly factor-like uncharacterized protein